MLVHTLQNALGSVYLILSLPNLGSLVGAYQLS